MCNRCSTSKSKTPASSSRRSGTLLEEEVGRENLRFPKEIILLGGAPGAGKGTQTQFISEARGLTCPPIVISELLTTPEMEKIKAQGGMVGDKEVLTVLLRTLLDADLSRRRHPRRLSAHAGPGRVSEAAGGQDQRAARRVRAARRWRFTSAVRRFTRWCCSSARARASRGSWDADARSPSTTGRWPRPASARRSSCARPISRTSSCGGAIRSSRSRRGRR